MNQDRLEWDFDYHVSNAEKVGRRDQVCTKAKHLASWINERVPDSREKSLAITKLEEAMFWANAAIARNPGPEDST